MISFTAIIKDADGIEIKSEYRVNIRDANDPPSDIYLYPKMVAETAPIGYEIGRLVWDDDRDTLSRLTDDAQGRFSLMQQIRMLILEKKG